jgi:catechol 2,3-dioxygenase
MRARSLGHVVLKVSDLRCSEAFYVDTLGMPVLGRISDPVHMTFFSLRSHHDVSLSHHDFALLEIDGDASPGDPRATGLAHVAFEIGDSLDDLRAAKTALASAGVTIHREQDHGFARSLYVLDPDANEVELYVDTSTAGGTGHEEP